MNDYYKTLGISRGASLDEIKRAYKKMAMQYHPDRNKGDHTASEKFKECSEAYGVLSNSSSRDHYNKFGTTPDAASSQSSSRGGFYEGGFSGFSSRGSTSSFDDGIGLEDILKNVFGGGASFTSSSSSSRKKTDTKGSDINKVVTIGMKESFYGGSVDISYNVMSSCIGCNGFGSESGKRPPVCAACKGNGRVRIQRSFFTLEEACSSCSGLGYSIEKACKKCSGEGRIKNLRNIQVNIPAGIDESTTLRVSKEGNAGFRGGDHGDLYISVKVNKDDLFERKNNDLYCKIPIKMTSAIIGCNVEITHIKGEKCNIQVPSGVQNGHIIKMPSYGFSILNSHKFGDLYAEVNVMIPKKINNKQKELLLQFEEEEENNGFFFNKKSEIFDKIKIKNIWK